MTLPMGWHEDLVMSPLQHVHKSTVDSRTRRVNSPGIHVSERSNGEREVKEITANYECKSSPWPSVAIESNLLITEDQPQDPQKIQD